MTSATLSPASAGADASPQAFSDFLATFKAKLHHAFHVRADVDEFSTKRGLPPFVLREILSANPLSAFIPSEHGGRGGKASESIAVLSAASYESLALSLTFGINWALFIQPVAKYGKAALKESVFSRFINEQNMGGLMLTEPDYGSDLLSMQTAYTKTNDHYHVTGTKHWGGLTGWADYWLVAARQDTGERGLKRDIDFFVADMNASGQHIEVEEIYENLGLYMIPYGRNKLDLHIPKLNKLEPHSTGVRMMLDLLHRSRMQFPGMAMGFLQRLLDEGIEHCKTRLVGSGSLFDLDQVQRRLATLQANFTICSAMCAYSAENIDMNNDYSLRNIEANTIKAVVTDIMQASSQSLLQLVGGQGYRLNHIAGRAVVDSRPFQIFEGSNDLLYTQISEAILKLMRKEKVGNLLEFLKTYAMTNKVTQRFGDALNFEVDLKLPQRKLVDLGRALGRLMSMQFVFELGHKGFRSDLIDASLSSLQQDIMGLLSTFKTDFSADVVDDYQENASWLDLV